MSANDTTNGPRWSGRRARAARMLAAGVSMTRVSSALGLSPARARRYESIFAAGGVDALLALRDVGRQSRLSGGALEQVIRAIRQAPGRVGMPGECWTNSLVQH
jgi:transposase